MTKNRNVHEQWTVKLFTVSEDSYDHLDMRNRTFPTWIVSHVLRGEVRTTTNGVSFQVRSGDVMLHPPYLPFSESAETPGIHQWMAIEVQMAFQIDLFRYFPVHPVIRLQNARAFSDIFHRLYDVWNDRGIAFHELAASSYALQLVHMLLTDWDRQGRNERPEAFSDRQDRFFRLIAYMSQHLEEKITREDLAALVHLNPNYLDRTFSEAYGVAPLQMLRDMRLRKAKQLLETTRLPLSSVASAVGLTDASHLSHWFMRMYGTTPGSYREGINAIGDQYLATEMKNEPGLRP